MFRLFSEYLRYTLETGAACLLLTYGLLRKPHFPLRLGLIAIGAAALSAALAAFSLLSAVPVYLLLTLYTVLFVLVPCTGPAPNRMLAFVSGVMLRMCARKLFDCAASLFTSPLIERGQPLRYVLYYALLLTVYAAASIAYARTRQSGDRFPFTWRTLALWFGALTVSLLLNRVDPILEEPFPAAYRMLTLCEAGFCALLLAMQLSMLRTAQAQADATLTKALWAKDKQHYEQLRESVESVRIRFHDLKHQLQAQGGAYTEALSRSVAAFDSQFNTGNETLDVILADKQLRCEALGIQLTASADGSLLQTFLPEEIYSLFGNLLDNAIECEQKLAVPEDRFIALSVREAVGCVSIRAENAFTGVLTLENGLPVTTKGDNTLHGYGLKSVRQIVLAHGGTLAVDASDDVFTVKILLPREKA